MGLLQNLMFCDSLFSILFKCFSINRFIQIQIFFHIKLITSIGLLQLTFLLSIINVWERCGEGVEKRHPAALKRLKVASPYFQHPLRISKQRKQERQRLNRFTHCLRLTRRRGGAEKSASNHHNNPAPLRVSESLYSPCFAEGQSASDHYSSV